MEIVHSSPGSFFPLQHSNKQFQVFQRRRSCSGTGSISGRNRLQAADSSRFRRSYALQSSSNETGAFSASEEVRKSGIGNPIHSFWNAATENFAASATFAFLLLQLPQTILNAQNLMAGNKSALFAVSWMSLLTSLMGNLSLLSYFAMKKENGAVIVQAVGVLSTYVVLAQLAAAGSMPPSIFIATSVAVGLGYIVNFLNYTNHLSSSLWRLWQDIISIGGVSILSQVMWSTFEACLPPSLVPGMIATVAGFTLIVQERRGKLPPSLHSLVGGLAAWSATLLFMWSPIAQMWMNISNPANLKGLSVFSVLLAMIGNSLLLPRALFTRDLMWFTGSSWGALVQGWGLLLSMFIYDCISGAAFVGITAGLSFWIGNMLVMDSKAYGLDSPLCPLAQLFKSTDSR